MSKCNLTISFDRDDRVYEAGDTVRCVVKARAIEAFSCRALVVRTFWRTHGRGNRATGGEKILHTLPAPSWRTGEEYTQDLTFQVPNNPVTYRGEYLNIDYYVEVKLDLPWAIDQKEAVDFVVHPGGWDMNQKRVARTETKPTNVRPVVWWVFALLAIVAWFVFGRIVAFMIALAGFAIVYGKPLRRYLSETGLGPVDINLASTRVTQGESIPITIRFKPVRALTLNGVTAKLSAREICYSGSGSNRKRHKKDLLERAITLSAGKSMRAGEQQGFDGIVDIPLDSGFSFAARDNKLEWQLQCHVDVAGWPDRVQRIPLDVLPGYPLPGTELRLPAAHGDARPRRPAPGGQVSVRKEPEPADDALRNVLPPPPAPPAPPQTAAPLGPGSGYSGGPGAAAGSGASAASDPDHTPTPMDAPLAEVLKAVASTDRFSEARAKAIEYLADKTFEFTAEVGRVGATFSFDVPEGFRDGRTVEGTLVGGGTEVVLRFPAEHNDLVDQLDVRQQISVTGVLTRWDDFRDRAELEISWWEGPS